MLRALNTRRKRARAGAWGLWALLAAGCVLAWRAGGGHEAARGGLTLALFGAGSWAILVRTRPFKLPVLNYHSVTDRQAWLRIGDRIALTPRAFERQLAWLCRRGYTTLFVSEAHEILCGRRAPPRGRRCVALTFDDGYADNAATVYPLLKRYGVKATIFVSTDFVRETRAGEEGYLTWGELRSLRDSGLVEIQAHGAAHTRVMAGRRLRGFVAPDRPNPWLHWNEHPETKARWWQVMDTDASLWGHPVFEQKPALAARAWLPDPRGVAHMLEWTRGRAPALFARAGWERALRQEWDRWLASNRDGSRGETEEEYESRVERDLREARDTIAGRLGVAPRFLCWPEGAFTAQAERVARAVGYVATLSNRHDTLNRVGESPARIGRVFVGPRFAGFRSETCDFAGFVMNLKSAEGNYAAYPLQVLASLARTARNAADRRRPACRRDYFANWG